MWKVERGPLDLFRISTPIPLENTDNDSNNTPALSETAQSMPLHPVTADTFLMHPDIRAG